MFFTNFSIFWHFEEKYLLIKMQYNLKIKYFALFWMYLTVINKIFWVLKKYVA